MKCLTVLEPWASCIFDSEKNIENRTWSTTHRGPLLIHTGKDARWGDLPRIDAIVAKTGKLRPHFFKDLGCIIGTVDLVDCVHFAHRQNLADNPWAEPNWCWILKNPVRFEEAIPARGFQRLWEFEYPVKKPAAADPKRR